MNPQTYAPGIGFKVTARASVVFDTTRLADFAKSEFLPSAIPVRGSPFYGAGEQATVVGNGSSAQIFGSADTPAGPAKANVTFVAQTLGPEGVSGTVQNATLQLNSITVGVAETAFADPTTEPATLDIAGPNARVTVQQPSQLTGQGRLGSFIYFSGDKYEGFIGDVSIEQPTPEVLSLTGKSPGMSFSSFASVPDLIATIKYGEGAMNGKLYDEFWHIQFGSVFRSIGDQNDTETIRDQVFGWGIQLSGIYTFPVNSSCQYRDSVGFSVTDGQGIAHYINDLHVASGDLKNGGNDAAFNSNGQLVALPAMAFYVDYTHNWSDNWQSMLCYSAVQLDSITPATGYSFFPTTLPSPYRRGQYVGTNLIYHYLYTPSNLLVASGIEYLFGEHVDLATNKGQDQRLLYQLMVAK